MYALVLATGPPPGTVGSSRVESQNGLEKSCQKWRTRCTYHAQISGFSPLNRDLKWKLRRRDSADGLENVFFFPPGVAQIACDTYKINTSDVVHR